MDKKKEYIIFRLQDGTDLSGSLKNWDDSVMYDENRISIIESSNEATTVAPTSIPSPFARMDLARTAFANVAKDLKGAANMYQKIVSDTLDVAEIFFNYDKLRDKVEIIVWDKTTDLANMIQSQPVMGRTLEKFINRDSDSFHFDKLNRLYILNYIGPDRPMQMNIIGATSPVTLFFSVANEQNKKGDDLSYVSPHIHFGQDMPFDKGFQPLYNRDDEFIKYMYAFQKSVPQFASLFPEVNSYLDECHKLLRQELKDAILKQSSVSVNDYEKLNLGNDYVEILGYHFHKRPDIKPRSDFEISSTVYQGAVKPLVLPIESGNEYANKLYTQSPWGTQNKAPYYDEKALQDRVLPFEGSKFPYLTISDFLSDTVVKMPYEMNNEAFFDGGIEGNGPSCFLLPLTKAFFDYFTVNDLKGMVDTEGGKQKKMFEMKRLATGVEVVLRIPIKKGIVEYQRNYYENTAGNNSQNKGGIIEKSFGLGVFPLVRCQEEALSHFRVALFDKTNNDVVLGFFKGNASVEVDRVMRRECRENCSVETYVLEHEDFDRIVVNVRGCQAVIVPKFKPESGQAAYTFAVDFGTTNTYIEYSVDGNPSKSFDITENECQMQRLHVDYRTDRDVRDSFDNNFVPQIIAEGKEYEFPIRTAFAEHKDIDYNKSVYALASGNIPFKYEKDVIPPYNVVRTDLKWSSTQRDRIKLFIENLIFMMRNKVLLNGGRLSNTKVVWFYPASMTEAQKNQLRTIWDSLYEKYFGTNAAINVTPMSESIAPYYYYRNKQGARSNAITIDVGGETTDIYAVENNIPMMLTSFRFASNAVFGDGYNWDADNNGFVKLYQEEIQSILRTNNLVDLDKAFAGILDKKKSSDIIAFFFSLAGNKQVTNLNVNSLNFLQKLSDNKQLKYVFVLFYASIVYHVACTMKAKGLQVPSTIAFSGNGSRTLAVLSPYDKTLADFFGRIFSKVYGGNAVAIDVILENQPKKATCKGGILSTEAQAAELREDIKFDLLGCDDSTSIEHKTLSGIDETTKGQIVNEVLRFVAFAKDLNRNDYYRDKFDVDASVENLIDELFTKDKVNEYLKEGIDRKKQELTNMNAQDSIDETLFFYPFIGLLNELAREISKLREN
jgi:hypothetical protein